MLMFLFVTHVNISRFYVIILSFIIVHYGRIAPHIGVAIKCVMLCYVMLSGDRVFLPV